MNAVQFLDGRLPDLFWSKASPCPMSGCWIWTAALTTDGYGAFASARRKVRAHRFAYVQLVGAVPDGLQLDHLCRTPACVNPAHLEPVTAAVNMARGRWATKTHCPQGHAYNDENTYVHARASGHRVRCCRACNRARKSGGAS